MQNPESSLDYDRLSYMRQYQELDLANKPILIILKTANLRCIICNALNYEQLIPTDNGLKRDYRGLFELLKLPSKEARNVERSADPMLSILVYLNGLCSFTDQTAENSSSNKSSTSQLGSNGLNNYISSANGKKIVNQFATIELLMQALEKLDRFDVIDDLLDELRTNPIDETVIKEIALLNQKRLAGDDAFETTSYDAYVSYVDSDFPFVQELCNFLESPEINFKLFIRERDLLIGMMEYADFTDLMQKQCNKLLLILSPEFIKSAECEFQAKFTFSLQIEERNRRLIPIIYKPCNLPLFIKFLSKIDLSKGNLIPNWTWQKLVTSLLNDNNRQIQFLSNVNHNKSSCLSIHTLNSSLNCRIADMNTNQAVEEDGGQLRIRNVNGKNSPSNSINSLNGSDLNRSEIPKIKIALEAGFNPEIDSDRNTNNKTISTMTAGSLTTTSSFSSEDNQALIEKQKGFKLFSKIWKNLSSKIK